MVLLVDTGTVHFVTWRLIENTNNSKPEYKIHL